MTMRVTIVSSVPAWVHDYRSGDKDRRRRKQNAGMIIIYGRRTNSVTVRMPGIICTS
jgi:hypothetical protein